MFRQLCSNVHGDHSFLYSSQQRWTWPWGPILDRACPFLHLAHLDVSVPLTLLKQQSFCAYLSCLGYQNESKSLLEPYTSAQSVETSQIMVSYRDEKICLQHPCMCGTRACAARNPSITQKLKLDFIFKTLLHPSIYLFWDRVSWRSKLVLNLTSSWPTLPNDLITCAHGKVSGAGTEL